MNLNTLQILHDCALWFHNTDAYYVWWKQWQWDEHALRTMEYEFEKDTKTFLIKSASDEMKSMLVMLNVMNYDGTAWIHTW